MILAALDWCAYKSRRFRYSAGAMAAAGWRPVTSQTLSAARLSPPATIFVLHNPRAASSWAVMYVTNSVASHTAIYLGEDLICDATSEGTLIRQLADLLTDGTWFVDSSKRHIPDDIRDRIVQAAVSLVGTPYNWQGAFIIGLEEALGCRAKANPRLWIGIAVILSLPGAVFAVRRDRMLFATFCRRQRTSLCSDAFGSSGSPPAARTR